MAALGEVANSGRGIPSTNDLDRDRLPRESGCLEEGLEALRIAEVPGVKKVRPPTTPVPHAGPNQLQIRPVVDDLDLLSIGTPVDEVITEAWAARDHGVRCPDRASD